MGAQRKQCCICGGLGPLVTNKKACKNWRPSRSVQKYFATCFCAEAEERSGDICPDCKSKVYIHRDNPDKCFPNVLDVNKGKGPGRPTTSSCKLNASSQRSCENVLTVKIDNEHNYFAFSRTVTPIIQSSPSHVVSDDVVIVTDTGGHALDDGYHDNNDENTSVPPSASSPSSLRKRFREESEDHFDVVSTENVHHDGDFGISSAPPPMSPTKRSRDEERRSVDLVVGTRRQVFNTRVLQHFNFVNFLGCKLPTKIVSHIMSFLPPEDALLVTTFFLIPLLLNDCVTSQQQSDAKLVRLRDVPKTGPLTQPQKAILHDLIVNRENNVDNFGCISIPQVGSGGKPKYFMNVPKVQKDSSRATKRTKDKRSQIIEQVERICSSPSPGDEVNIKQQRINNIKRDKQGYAAASEEAGLKIVAKFNKRTVMSLRGIMTLKMWRLLKRVFKDEVGWDVYGSVGSMQKEIKSIEYEYECGTVTTTLGEKVHFVRVKNIKEVVSQLVNELRKADLLRYLQNLNENSLWLHTSADKGGKSTKLILQVINQKDRHSIDYAKLIGYFEGKDGRENLESIFGPLLEELQKCAATISELCLQRPVCNTTTQPYKHHSEDCKCDETVTWTPLVPFDMANTTISDQCKHCKKCPSKPIHPQHMHVRDDQSQTSEALAPTPTIPSPVQPQTPVATAISRNNPGLQITPTSLGEAVHDETPSSKTTCMQSSLPQRSLDDCTPSRAVHNEANGILPRNLFPETTLPVHPDHRNEPVTETEHSEIFTECGVTVGGDWEGCAKLLGLSGPNGKHFCNHCLVILDEVRKGVPHAAHILPKYQEHTNGNPAVLPNSDDFLRSFERCKEKHEEYVAAGNKAQVKNFENCDRLPLVSGGKVIDTFSTTPLHISLGIGLQVLNVIEGDARKLDKGVKEAEGQYDAFAPLYDHKKDILSACQTINDKIDEVVDKIDQVSELKKEIIRERAIFFKKNSRGNYVNNSDLACGVRSRYANLDKDKGTYQKEKEKLEKQLNSQETKLKKVGEELDKVKGPFMTKMDQVLDSLKLKRAAYHSGALIGPDVKKLITKVNIPKLAAVFRPITVQVTKDGVVCDQQFSSHQLRVKIITLLNKFKQCYELYTANRPLCRHEVELLALRCASFGGWFPVTYRNENLKRKFHLLTVDVPKQARRMQSTGIITEQTIESIHPYINELDRRFAKVADKTKKGLIICKQQNIYSQPSWNCLKKSCGKKIVTIDP